MCIFDSESACEMLKGHTYTSSDDSELIKPNPPTNEVCAEKCKKRIEDNPYINGMIWQAKSKRCGCMSGMQGAIQWTGYDICYFRKST